MVRLPELFPRERVIGVFRGFQKGGLEFQADLALPYRSEFHSIPMHGQLLLVQLETPEEAVLGRITSLSSDGRLSGTAGEDYNIRAVREERPVSEQLRRDFLKYQVRIRVLGVVRIQDEHLLFVPSHRRLPHVGSPVAFLPPEALQLLIGHHDDAAPLGVVALGEYVYSGGDDRIEVEDWMQIMTPAVFVNFAVEHLVATRTFIFARAGFGKSNLNKLLFSQLYQRTPTVPKRGRGEVPVGTLIFDPEGEYFWPDDKGRPGLCDVPQLQDRMVVFTSRKAPSEYYESFVVGGIKLDVRRLKPADVISIGLSPEKQDQQNVRKLRGMNPTDWSDLVDLVHEHGNSADLGQIRELLHLEPDQYAEALAARANMTAIVRMLHDKGSRLMDLLLDALSAGRLCVVDLSQLRGGPSLVLSGLILRRIFDHNQEEFTKAESKTIPTIAVLEEAQAVLGGSSSASAPYVEWVKEGRKYDLGAVMITQQPGSIPTEILSQGDNWFIFHLLSAADLQSVKKANAHFSEDLLSSLLNEPIKGQGLFWSSVGSAPFPIPLRVFSFESLYKCQDPQYNRSAFEGCASELKARINIGALVGEHQPGDPGGAVEAQGGLDAQPHSGDGPDVLQLVRKMATHALRDSINFRDSIDGDGIPWGVVVGLIHDSLPDNLHDRKQLAYDLVPYALNMVFGGEQDKVWKTVKKGRKNTTFVVKVENSDKVS